MKQIRYETGQRFGRWTVIGEGIKYKGTLSWKCKCDCGSVRDVPGSRLRYGKSNSCGCINVERVQETKWKGCGELGMNMWTTYKRGAKLRNIPFDITIEDAWNLFVEQQRKCALTGLDLIMFEYDTNYRDYAGLRGGTTGKRIQGTASLDRIDSTKGYTIDNVQWVHKDVNMMKLDHSVDYLIELCELIVAHNKNKNC